MICCIYCRKEYSLKGIHTHYYRSHGTVEEKIKFSSGYNGKYHEISNILKERGKIQRKIKMNEYYLTPKYCLKCCRVIEFEKRTNDYCSRSCGNNRGPRSLETKQKISEKLKNLQREIDLKFCIIHHCKNCNNQLKNRKVFCSRECVKIFKQKYLTSKQKYKHNCSFKFSLNDYPNYFDFSLIEKYGWYSATNRGNNLNGVSRDHMISIEYGFKNNIPPEIISHPANCQLLQHRKNKLKGTKCDITLEELLEKINDWNN